ncbi:MAG: hypothetical protein PVH88_04770 [Ignavibacteria bacterium]|jgi:hypothetical protein
MKKVALTFLTCFLIFSSVSKAQDVSVDLIVFEPLPEIEFAAFAAANNLSGQPRVFQVVLNPAGQIVSLHFAVEWKKIGESSFQRFFSFETEPFIARNFYNDEIGSTDIRVKDTESNSDLTEENLEKGKPTGAYKISVSVFDENGSLLDSDVQEMEFLNPTQTLSIRSPQPGSEQDIGGVLAEWDEINGVTNYFVKANVRESKAQSLEEALDSGVPLINNKDVGVATSVNLRTLLEREWFAGQEIIFQVGAFISGPNGGTKIYSEIVNFYLPIVLQVQGDGLEESLKDVIQDYDDDKAAQLLAKIQSGEIQLTDITVEKYDGTSWSFMTMPELQSLMEYFQSNPDAVISIKFIPE